MRLLESYGWLKGFSKTPADLGLPWGQVDPVWRRAMMVIEAGMNEQLEMRRRRAEAQATHGHPTSNR